MKTPLRVLSTLCLSALLVACSSTPSNTLGQLPPTKYEDLDKLLVQAGKKSDSQAVGLYLAAADLAWQAKNALQARDILSKVNFAVATPAQQVFANTLEAELALARKQPEAALKALGHASFAHLNDLPLQQQVRSQLARAQALQATGQPLAAARERIYLAPWLKGVDAFENHEIIWQLEQYPQHPAAQMLPNSLRQLQQLQATQVQSIALLLPSQDPNQNVVTALRNGFLAAHYIAQASGEATAKVRVYDSSHITSLDAFYQQAATDGVDLVVGPWEKNLVGQLASRSQLPITTLALNYADTEHNTPKQLFQYGLAAEDEARVAAERAWADGMRRAAALVPKSAWGERILAAFTQHWKTLGGELIATQHFDRPAALPGQIAQLFELRESEQRAKQLENALDTKVAAQPARRQDIDFLFLAASPQQARQIKPALTFQYADDVPVYATSAVNSGNGDIHPELTGLQFSEMPWFIESDDPTRQHITYNWPQASGSMGRFYAMGADAYQLAHQLQQLTAISNSSAVGLTGTLKLNSEQRIERSLYWATISNKSIKQLKECQRD